MSRTIIRCAPLTFILALPALANAQEDWRMFQFQENERYLYEFTMTEDGETTRGSYELAVEAAGAGRLKMSVEGRMGDAECSASATMESGQVFPPQLMMSCATMAPVLMAFAMPTWGWFLGRSWRLGDEWSMSQGGESFSFRIERECSYAGQQGLLAVIRQNDEVHLQACVATDVALPLAVMFREDGDDRVELKLVEYSR